MIQEMRDSLFKGKYSAQVLVFIMIFAIAGISFTGFTSLFKKNKEHAIGHVGPQSILKYDLEVRIDEYNRLIEYFEKQFGAFAKTFLSMQGLQDPKTFVLQRLKSEMVLSNIYASSALTISPEYITQKMQDTRFLFTSLGSFVPPYVVDPLGGINQKALVHHLSRHGITLETFDSMVHNALQKDFAIKLIQDSFYDLSCDNNSNNCLAEKAHKSFLIGRLHIADYIEREQHAKGPSIEELKQFYSQENQAHKTYWTTEKRTGVLWTFSADTYNRKISDSAIAKYYQDHKKEYIIKPERMYLRRIVFTDEALAKKVHAELRNKQDLFAEYARKYSVVTKEASKSGDFGSIEFHADTKSLTSDQKIRQEKAFALYKDGAISDVYKTADGYEIIGRIRKEFATFKPLESVSSIIATLIRQKTFIKIFQQEAREIIRKSPEDFMLFIQKHGAKKEVISDDRLRELVKVGAKKVLENGMIIELTSFEAAKMIPFDAVRSQVESDFRINKAQKQFEADSKSIQLSIEKTAQFPAATTFGFSTETVSIQSPLDWQSPTIKALPLDRMKRMIHVSKFISVLPDADKKMQDAVYIQLTKCNLSDEKTCENKEKSKEFSKKTLTKDQFMENVIVSFMRNVTMEIDPVILTQLLK